MTGLPGPSAVTQQSLGRKLRRVQICFSVPLTHLFEQTEELFARANRIYQAEKSADWMTFVNPVTTFRESGLPA